MTKPEVKKEMSIVAALDKVLFFNEASKYCVLRLKTADAMIPADAKSPYRYSDHLIRFTAVGYDLPYIPALIVCVLGNMLPVPFNYLFSFSFVSAYILSLIFQYTFV